MSRRGWLLFLALGVVWGIPYLLIQVAVRAVTPATLVFLRTAIGAAVLLPVALARGDVPALRAHWRPIALFTLVELAVPWLLLSDVERRVSSSLAGLFIASVPIVGAVLARLLGTHEPLGRRRLAGLLVGLAGVVLLLGLDLGTRDPWAIVELSVVVVGYALGPIVVARGLSDLPSREVIAVCLALCAVVYAPFGIAQLPRAWPPAEVVGAVVALGLVCTALAFLLFFALIAEVGPVRATVITYVNPAVAVAVGVGFGGDRFTPGLALGFVLILAGSWLATGQAVAREVEAPAPRVGGA
jgi:drug/metabolite transporter (DMT)-like permease